MVNCTLLLYLHYFAVPLSQSLVLFCTVHYLLKMNSIDSACCRSFCECPSSEHTLQLNILQLILGFYCPHSKQALEMFTSGWQTRVTCNEPLSIARVSSAGFIWSARLTTGWVPISIGPGPHWTDKQNRNRSATAVCTVSTKRRHFLDALNFYLFFYFLLFLTLRVSKQENESHFWIRPTLSTQKISDSDELLVDMQNGDLRLSGEVWLSFKKFFFAVVNWTFREFLVLLVQQLTRKIQTSEMLSVWRNACNKSEIYITAWCTCSNIQLRHYRWQYRKCVRH
jgi:hypothetical protein